MSTHGEAARDAERQRFVLVVERIRKLERDIETIYEEMITVVKQMEDREGVDVSIRITPALAAGFKVLEAAKETPEDVRLPSILRGHAETS